MRVVVVHAFYQQFGGEDAVFAAETGAMRAAGWEVETVEASNFDLDSKSRVQLARDTVWNSQAARLVGEEIRRVKPDVVHVHNFFPSFSPAVHWAAASQGVAVVQRLPNFRLGCLNSFLHRNGEVCEDCLGKIPIKGVLRKCYRDSAGASAVIAGMQVAHRALGTWQKKVHAFVTPSSVAREKLIKAGLPEDRLYVKPNMVSPDPGYGEGKGDYIIYVGRLSPEKGISTMLNAWASDPSLPKLHVAGSGPLEEIVNEAAAKDPRITPLGYLDRKTTIATVQNAIGMVFPTEWHEVFGMSAAESIACGTPVASTPMGAAPELLGQGDQSVFFEPRNSTDLARAVHELVEAVPLERRRAAARQRYLSTLGPEANVRMIEAIYKDAIERAHSGMHAVAR